LKSLRAPSPGGPVGLSFATLGYTIAVLVARTFVYLEAHCVQACPIVHVSGFRMHHLYYGLALLALSGTVLALAEDIRTKWDGALVVGIGLGLVADEIGLIIFNVSYWDPVSTTAIASVGLALGLTALGSALHNGVDDFHILSRYDVLTAFAVLLGMTGFLYFDRPIRTYVEIAALSSWAISVALFSTAGRAHVLRIRKGHLNPPL